ncbi:MAG: dihydrofolate reductase [Tissierellia bacterium]|nr:dihydrofolate reductase [Tissierellia bacterium]
MILMLAVDNNFSIGLKGDMLFHLKKDLARFQNITSGNILVMGRKTLESLPGSRPLPNRTHLVLTKNDNYKNHDAIVLSKIDELDQKLKEINPNQQKQVFLVGGGNLVAQLLDKCHKAYITKVDKTYENFDTKIPNLDRLDNWELVEESDQVIEYHQDEKFTFKYLTYVNKNYRK